MKAIAVLSKKYNYTLNEVLMWGCRASCQLISVHDHGTHNTTSAKDGPDCNTAQTDARIQLQQMTKQNSVLAKH